MVAKKILRPQGNAFRSHEADVKLVPSMVKKSLEVNPSLARAATPSQAIAELRSQVREARSSTEPAVLAPASMAMADRRVQAAAFFMAQKQDDFDRLDQEAELNIRAAEAEREALRARTIQEITNLMTVVWSDADDPPPANVLGPHRAFLSRLKVSDSLILSQIGKQARLA